MAAVSNDVGRILVNLPLDMEIAGRTYWQAREILGHDFCLLRVTEANHARFSATLLDTALKLSAMKHHMGRYRVEEEAYLEYVSTPRDEVNRTHVMLFELEAFLFQLKSSLDIAVKMLDALLPGRMRTRTFEDKGGRLVRGLEQFKHDSKAKVDMVNNLIRMLGDDREAWLEQAISLRDKVSHYHTLPELNYMVSGLVTGDRKVAMPHIGDRPVQDYMALLFANCIEFIQDFMCLSVGISLPATFSIRSLEPGQCSVGEPIAHYIKFGLAANRV